MGLVSMLCTSQECIVWDMYATRELNRKTMSIIGAIVPFFLSRSKHKLYYFFTQKDWE